MKLKPIITFFVFLLSINIAFAVTWNNGESDTNFTNYKIYTINSTVNSTLVDFPITLKINTSALISAGKLQSDCDDLRPVIINNSNTSQYLVLSYEILPYTCNTESTYIYVKIPYFRNTTESLFLYYGNSGTISRENIPGVWSNGYMAVYHPREITYSAGGTVTSSSYLSNGTIGGSAYSILNSTLNNTPRMYKATGGTLSDYIRFNASNPNTESYTITAWEYINTSEASGNPNVILVGAGGSGIHFYIYHTFGTNTTTFSVGSSASVSSSTNSHSRDTWNFFSYRSNVSNRNITLGTNLNTNVVSGTKTGAAVGGFDMFKSFGEATTAHRIGEFRWQSVYRIDDWILAEYSTKYSESVEYTSAADSYLLLSVNNSINNTLLSSFSYSYNTSNSSDSTTKSGYCNVSACPITSYKASSINISVYNISSSTYLNTSLHNINFNSLSNVTVYANTSKSYLRITALRYIDNTSVSSFAGSNGYVSNSTTNGILYINADSGTNSLSFSGSSYVSSTQNCVATSLTLSNCTVYFYDTLMNITLKNKWSNSLVSTFSGYAIHNGTNTSISYSTTNGTAFIYAIKGNYTVYITAPGYSIGSNNYNQTVDNDLYFNVTYYLYSNNSIVTDIYKQSDGSRVYDNITITTNGDTIFRTNYTNTSTSIIDNLIDGVYSIVFSSLNYSSSTYIVTVTDSSTQQLNAYLVSNASNSVTFLISDYESSQPIREATASMYRVVGSSKVLIESQISDIGGYVIFDYLPGTRYDFIISADGYTSTQFTLDPVIFSSYDIKLLSQETASSETNQIKSVVYYSPTQYFYNATNNFSIVFYSDFGSLSSYNVSLEYPGGSYFNSGTNSGGSVFNTSISVNSANYGDMINITYCYVNVDSTSQCYTYKHDIIGIYNNQTLISIKDNTYGLGLMERVLIVTFIALGISVFTIIYFGIIGGVLSAIVIYAIFTLIGFVPVWIFIITFIGAMLLIIKGVY